MAESFFDSLKTKVSQWTGYGSAPMDKQERQCKQCEKWLSELEATSPIVRFMQQHTALLSPDAKPVPIHCAPCNGDEWKGGGYAPGLQSVLICQDQIMNKKHMEDTIAHELIHGYDDRRFKVDWKNLRHIACTEIRASTLSGDCSIRRRRDVMDHFVGYFQDCVKRRATLSVAMSPHCPDKETAEKAVNEVWQSCFPDTRPFDEIY